MFCIIQKSYLETNESILVTCVIVGNYMQFVIIKKMREVVHQKLSYQGKQLSEKFPPFRSISP